MKPNQIKALILIILSINNCVIGRSLQRVRSEKWDPLRLYLVEITEVQEDDEPQPRFIATGITKALGFVKGMVLIPAVVGAGVLGAMALQQLNYTSLQNQFQNFFSGNNNAEPAAPNIITINTNGEIISSSISGDATIPIVIKPGPGEQAIIAGGTTDGGAGGIVISTDGSTGSVVGGASTISGGGIVGGGGNGNPIIINTSEGGGGVNLPSGLLSGQNGAYPGANVIYAGGGGGGGGFGFPGGMLSGQNSEFPGANVIYAGGNGGGIQSGGIISAGGGGAGRPNVIVIRNNQQRRQNRRRPYRRRG